MISTKLSETPAADRYRDFLNGFASAYGCTVLEAKEHWAAFSRQMSNAAIELAEQQGSDAGFEMGNLYRNL